MTERDGEGQHPEKQRHEEELRPEEQRHTEPRPSRAKWWLRKVWEGWKILCGIIGVIAAILGIVLFVGARLNAPPTYGSNREPASLAEPTGATEFLTFLRGNEGKVVKLHVTCDDCEITYKNPGGPKTPPSEPVRMTFRFRPEGHDVETVVVFHPQIGNGEVARHDDGMIHADGEWRVDSYSPVPRAHVIDLWATKSFI